MGVTDVKAKNALADLKRKNPKYKEQAYLFVLSALHRRLSALPPPGPAMPVTETVRLA